MRSEREKGRKISRITPQFLTWIGGWVVGYASEIENTERVAGLREGRELKF